MPAKSFFLSLLLVTACAASAQSQEKIALVIGVQNYANIPKLRHSLNDAQDISATLTKKGFKVESLYDPKSKAEMRAAILRYYNKMKDLNGAVGIIYYSGHGVQNEAKENYLIPAAAPAIEFSSDLDNECVKMNTIMSVLNSSTNLNILLLDACRTNSIPSFGRDVAQGLSKESAPQGSIVVFATQPGKTASDGTGRNGLFTSKLLKHIDEPGLNISEVFRKVKEDVFAESQKTQLPSLEDNSFGGEFYFEKPVATKSAETKSTATKTVTSEKRKVLVQLDMLVANFDYYSTNSKSLAARQVENFKRFKGREDTIQMQTRNYQANISQLTIGQAKAIEEDLDTKKKNLQTEKSLAETEVRNELAAVIAESKTRIYKFVEQYAQKNNLDLEVLTGPKTNFGGSRADITTDVMMELNREYRGGGN